MTPPAFLALWNGVVAGREAEYEAWHSQEHVPERLGAPGFRAACRYRAEAGGGYFTVYELDGLEALDTAAYLSLVRDPTAWSAVMRTTLTDFHRRPCRTLAAERFGRGGAVATLRLPARDGSALSLLRRPLDRALSEGRLLGFLLGEVAQIGRPYEAFPDARPPQPESVLVLDATEPAGLRAVVRACQEALGGDQGRAGFWRLLQILGRGELRDPDLGRQRAREDLRGRWNTAGAVAAPNPAAGSPPA